MTQNLLIISIDSIKLLSSALTAACLHSWTSLSWEPTYVSRVLTLTLQLGNIAPRKDRNDLLGWCSYCSLSWVLWPVYLEPVRTISLARSKACPVLAAGILIQILAFHITTMIVMIFCLKGVCGNDIFASQCFCK